MEKKTLKAIFVNGSPRKNKNTALMLESAMRGAEAAGAQTELIHLYDIDFRGCKSCFACKLKNSKCNGVCALKDDLRPVLQRCREADVIVLGSPIPSLLSSSTNLALRPKSDGMTVFGICRPTDHTAYFTSLYSRGTAPSRCCILYLRLLELTISTCLEG